MRNKYIVFIPTGGMNHMLGLFSSVIQLSIKYNRSIYPMTTCHNAFGLRFSEIFAPIKGALQISDRACDFEEIVSLWDRDPAIGAGVVDLANLKLAVMRNIEGRNYYHLDNVPVAFGTPFYLMRPDEAQGADRSVWITTGDWAETSSLVSMQNLVISPKILRRVRSLREALPAKYIACHYRNTDYKTNFEKYVKSILKLAESHSISNVFVATDDIASIREFEEALDGCNVYCNPGMKFDIRQTTQKNSHFPSEAALRKFGMTKYDQHSEFFSEIYCCALADAYLENPNSSIRHMVRYLRADVNLFNSFFGV